MRWYVAVFYAGNHYYFGGTRLSSILCLNGSSWSWSNAGQLNSSRNGHGVILVGNTFTIVGGEGTLRNEACLLFNGQFNCTELSTSLTNYSWRPMLYLVDENYANCAHRTLWKPNLFSPLVLISTIFRGNRSKVKHATDFLLTITDKTKAPLLTNKPLQGNYQYLANVSDELVLIVLVKLLDLCIFLYKMTGFWQWGKLWRFQYFAEDVEVALVLISELISLSLSFFFRFYWLCSNHESWFEVLTYLFS